MQRNIRKGDHHASSPSSWSQRAQQAVRSEARALAPSPPSLTSIGGRVVRDAVRAVFAQITARFSDDAPSVDERVLQSRYAAVDAWPADAQLWIMVLGWALGPGFSLAGFRQAVNQLVPDFVGAARAIGVGKTPTLVTLGGIARVGFGNAAIVVRFDLDPEVLYWPIDMTRCTGAMF